MKGVQCLGKGGLVYLTHCRLHRAVKLYISSIRVSGLLPLPVLPLLLQVSAMLTPSASAPNLLLSTPSANGTINPEHSGSTSPHPTSLSPTFPLEGASAQEPTQQSLLLRFGDSLVLKETPAAPDPARPPGGSQAEDREFAGTMQEPTEVAAGTPDSASSGVQTDWTVFQVCTLCHRDRWWFGVCTCRPNVDPAQDRRAQHPETPLHSRRGYQTNVKKMTPPPF